MSIKTLVIVLCETRAHELTFDNFKKNVIDELNADLCLCIGVKDDYDYNNPFYKLAKYKFTYNEPEFYDDSLEVAYNNLTKSRPKYECLNNTNNINNDLQYPKQYIDDINNIDLIINHDNNVDNDNEYIVVKNENTIYTKKNNVSINNNYNNYIADNNVDTYKKHLHWKEFVNIESYLFGGIKNSLGSCGLILFYRWFLLQKLNENNLINLYDRFIITRSDYIYELPHPKMEILDEKYIWIPNGEDYGGFTDRHVILSKNNIEVLLNIFNNMVLESNKFFIFLKKENEKNPDYNNIYNLEKLIYYNLKFCNVLHLVKRYPYIMYTVRNIDGTTRWTHGNFDNNLGYYIKYSNEYNSSQHYKNEFEKSTLSINDFYIKNIY